MSLHDARVFLLFGKPYRWAEGLRLERVSDDEARCPAVFDRTPWLLRCEYLAGHDGRHSA